MDKDYFRFFVVLIIALLIGLIFNKIFLFLFLATAGCLIWQQQKLSQLLQWIQDRDMNEAPESPGNFEDICIEVDRQQLRHKKRKKKLAGYLQQFHQATTALPDATIVLDDEDRIQWANKAAAEFLNIHWPQDQRQRITNLIRSPELIKVLSHQLQDEHKTIDIKSPINSDVNLSLRIVPYGKNQRLFVARDVTRLQKLIDIRKDFVANVSHELRTPLTVLRGFLEMMATNKQCPEEWSPSFETMNSQADRMESVISDLLTISRLEEGPLVNKPEVVIVPEMIAAIHKEAVALSAEKQHLFNISIQSDLWIRGSSAEIYSAFSNLVFNAVRYTPANGLIGINWYEDEKGGAHMEISDNGIGIPPQHIPRLTERFYRVDQSRSRDSGGSGLGLSIVKHVLSRHKARLVIESKLGKGSVFHCDFPKEITVKKSSSEFNQTA